MKQKYNFQWFEPEDHRKDLLASVSRDGKLRLGKNLLGKLPPFIRVGYDTSARVLAIAGAGCTEPRYSARKVLSAQALSSCISSAGIGLPITFSVQWDDDSQIFIGHIVPRRKSSEPDNGYDIGQMQLLYQHIIDEAVYQMAKSTPLPERRAIATEAFYAAVKGYRAGYGNIESYLEGYIKKELLMENKQYSSAVSQRSLDRPMTNSSGDTFSLYDTLIGSDTGGIDRVEERIMAEQFIGSLTERERKLAEMLRDGSKLSQIAVHLRVDEAELVRMGKAIARKRAAFFQA